MRENNNKKWSIGLKFVQFEKNNSHHSGINRSPYKAMFGCEAKIGLSTSSLPWYTNDIPPNQYWSLKTFHVQILNTLNILL
jgi:hypothetical protein